VASSDIIAEVSKPEFYTRVSFISLKVAQNVAAEDPTSANHENRADYSSRIFRGDEDALMLSMHVVSANPTIAQTIENEGGAAVPDGDIEFALATIWDSRANAFASPSEAPTGFEAQLAAPRGKRQKETPT
jgi:hypothetical protein